MSDDDVIHRLEALGRSDTSRLTSERLGSIEASTQSVFAVTVALPAQTIGGEGNRMQLQVGMRLEADLILWGTGYATDLRWLDVSQLAAVRSVNELCTRCACIFRSIDAPDLYFPGVGLDGIGAAPWAYMLIARSIMSHIRGQARLDSVPVDHKDNHFDIVLHLAPPDPGSYPEGRGWDYYRTLALDTPDDQPYPLL